MNLELIREFLQDTDVVLSVGTNSSISSLNKDKLVPVPSKIFVMTNIAVLPHPSASERYWLARVEDVRTEVPLVYSIRFYKYNKNKKCWTLMRGATAYGTTPHAAILVGCIEFNVNNTLKASSINQIELAIKQK